ncbi:TraX family protein [Paenibacillus glacialis]|uniref:Conjugal transfer protein TraX n=1 Tax=Paenibacillus glacialis TaxID=494026 RepID=A0A168NNC7_9BACL|nr:TraX family protein [Paenibacillus glacialis]OAB45963.1 conjugal transfer protein TraX [Paenibacillus glacialis]
MQWIAMLTMLMDHIGYVFFPDEMMWRTIGRLAFPIYTYALVQGYLHTSNQLKYGIRLLIIAILSQLPYELAFDTSRFNVVATLFIAVLVMNILDRISSKILSVGIVLLFGILMQIIPFDYGAYGLVLVLLFKYLSSHELVFAHVFLNVVYLFSNNAILQMYSIVPTLVIVYGPILWTRLESIRVRKWIWRSFYPLHLSLIVIWKWVEW